MDIVDVGIIVVGALPILAVRDLRTPRAAAFFGAMSGLVLLASALSQPAQFAVKAVAIWSYVVVFLWFQHLLSGRPRDEAAIDRQLRRIAKDADGMVAARSGESAHTSVEVESLFTRMASLRPPTPAWARVVELMNTYYRHRLMIRDPGEGGTGDPSSRPSGRELEEARDSLVSAWERAFDRKQG